MPASPAETASPCPSMGRWPVLAVAAVALAVAGAAFARFHGQSRQLWTVMDHDRNAHYWSAQSLALDLRRGDLVHFARQLERSRVWGPLHPLITGAVMAAVGVHFEVAVWTALLPWAVTAVLAFLCVRRAVPWAGDAGGALAAFLVLASPAYQAFATDVMLESLGACLTLAVAHAYLRARQGPVPGGPRRVAVCLTLLFFLKYQYWLLVVVALAGAELARHAGGLREFLRGAVRGLGWHLPRAPLDGAFAGAVVGLAAVAAAGPRWLAPHLLLPLWALVVARALGWWLRGGRVWLRERWPGAAAVAAWHAWPVALWFLLPKRLSLFVWYLTRDHGGGGESDGTLPGRAAAYAGTLAADYHAGALCLLLVAGLALLGLALTRRLRPGGEIILWLLAVAVGLTLAQPTCRSRFVHSWVALAWVAAGVGLAGLVHARRPGALRLPRLGLAAGLAAALAVLSWPALLSCGHAPEGGLRPDAPCALDLADRFVPQLDGTRRVAVLSNYPLKFFAMWTCQQRSGRTERVVGEAYQLPADLDRTPCDAVVWIEVPERDCPPGVDPSTRDAVSRLLARGRFVVARRWAGGADGCVVTLWRAPGAAAVAGRGR